MKDHTNKEDRDAVSGWEDEGGVGLSGVGGQPDIARAAGDKRGSDRERLDASGDYGNTVVNLFAGDVSR